VSRPLECPHCGWTPAEQDKLAQDRADLLDALSALVEFDELDSVLDQQTDVRLRAARAEAWDRARALLSKAEQS
jgi:hypothetical protein